MNHRSGTTGESQGSLVALPRAPVTTSPVPWLTSIHSSFSRGPYGDPSYRGNCSGYLIRDLLSFFQPRNVLDPMAGSGTCRDVCQELGIPCTSFDLNDGANAQDGTSYPDIAFDFVWLHPPYWRMIRYSDDDRCLSNAPSLDDFLAALRRVIANGRDSLSLRGHLAILIGSYSDRGMQIPLPALTTSLAIEEGLWPTCTEIIRFQHGNSSSKKAYQTSFIPGLHDNCLVFERARS